MLTKLYFRQEITALVGALEKFETAAKYSGLKIKNRRLFTRFISELQENRMKQMNLAQYVTSL